MPTSKVPVFKASDWQSIGPNRWEAQAAPHDCEGRPPFEATCTNPDDGLGDWYWTLYQLDEASRLRPSGSGVTPTLSEAQHQADNHARRWRDNPTIATTQHRLAELDEYSTVTCDRCDTTHNLATLLHGGGQCDAHLDEANTCNSSNFDGRTIDELAEAVVR